MSYINVVTQAGRKYKINDSKEIYTSNEFLIIGLKLEVSTHTLLKYPEKTT